MKHLKTLITLFLFVVGTSVSWADVADGKNAVVLSDVETDPVNAVIAKITAIGYVEYTEACRQRIQEARDAYDALSEEQQKKVTNYNVLLVAEASYKEKTPAGVPMRTAAWNWDAAKLTDQIMKESAIGAYSIGYIHSNISGLSLELSTVAENTEIKQAGTFYYLYLPEKCKIRVPVRREADIVTIVCGPEKYNYTINNTQCGVAEWEYVATQEDADQGYVEIEIKGETCLFSIKLVQNQFSSVLPLIALNSEGWASFTSLIKGYVVACPLGAKAYVATSVNPGDGEYGSVTLREVTRFAYGEGVFIKGEQGNTSIYANIVEDPTAESDVPKGNLTVGCLENTPLFKKSNAYVIATHNMNTSDEKAGFWHVNTTVTVPAGKAYLYAPKAQRAKGLKITFADGTEATGVESLFAGAEAKTPAVLYNLSGQKVGKDYKGVVIGSDGKKYVK